MSVVKITACEKMGKPSKGVAVFYVNSKLNIHKLPLLWKTLVENPVENVENFELSTGIPSLSKMNFP